MPIKFGGLKSLWEENMMGSIEQRSSLTKRELLKEVITKVKTKDHSTQLLGD